MGAPRATLVAQRVRPRHGETACGDAVVAIHRDAESMLAVIDALGHGPHAAFAAGVTVAALERTESSMTIEDRFQRVHEELKGSRGVAMTLVLVTESQLIAAGVGNVSLRVTGLALPFINTPGVLGGVSRRPRIASVPRGPGCRLALHSDGVSGRFTLLGAAEIALERACESTFEAKASRLDDAALLLADVGPP